MTFTSNLTSLNGAFTTKETKSNGELDSIQETVKEIKPNGELDSIQETVKEIKPIGDEYIQVSRSKRILFIFLITILCIF